MGRLSGRVAFITGAARGQGRTHAVRLAEEGADVVISDICGRVETNGVAAATPDDLAETVRLVEKTGQRVIARQADVRDLGALESLADQAVSEFGGINVVVANAGILSWGNAWELSTEAWNELIDINLTGVFHTIKATVPHMISAKNGGSIILTSSSAGLKGQPFTLAYTAAKHGVVGITRGLANELGEYDIRVNSIHPAGVETEMMNVDGLFQMIQAKATTLGPVFMNTLPHQSMKPEAVSAVVAFLASDESRYLTGAQIPVDLGTLNR
ncbi:MAG TPA: mycofactocin-coupled SDR family oxidoreductase [Frankiaceae bacterium]|jgi:SDR family mycofactocin-dependent oxidoreductase|nr:mycofactocin-coupled SDR family oxidoreductase [Frankiaceae bacterium]